MRSGKYPIDLGPDVVIVNRLLLREADTGVDVILEGAYRGGQRISDGIPTMLEGVPLPIQQDRDHRRPRGLLPEPDRLRPAHADRDLHFRDGKTTTSSIQLQATGCDKLRSTRRST